MVTARYELNVPKWLRFCWSLMTMLWFRRSIAGRGSIPAQCVWYLCLSKWHLDRLVSEYFGFALSLSFHKCSLRNFSWCCSYLRDKPPLEHTHTHTHTQKKSEWSLGNLGALDKKVLDNIGSRKKIWSFGGVKLTLNINRRRGFFSLLL